MTAVEKGPDWVDPEDGWGRKIPLETLVTYQIGMQRVAAAQKGFQLRKSGFGVGRYRLVDRQGKVVKKFAYSGQVDRYLGHKPDPALPKFPPQPKRR